MACSDALGVCSILAMRQDVVFVSICPTCKNEQLQDQFSLEALAKLLSSGYPLEAYCHSCSKHFPISLQQRLELGATIAALMKGGC